MYTVDLAQFAQRRLHDVAELGKESNVVPVQRGRRLYREEVINDEFAETRQLNSPFVEGVKFDILVFFLLCVRERGEDRQQAVRRVTKGHAAMRGEEGRLTSTKTNVSRKRIRPASMDSLGV